MCQNSQSNRKPRKPVNRNDSLGLRGLQGLYNNSLQSLRERAGGLIEIIVLHDDSCPRPRGGPCNCQPEVREAGIG